MYTCCLFFFFQAEDGIRDGHVTGVQTCALPIFGTELDVLLEGIDREIEKVQQDLITEQEYQKLQNKFESDFIQDNTSMLSIAERSEERRVGKENRSRAAAERWKITHRRPSPNSSS